MRVCVCVCVFFLWAGTTATKKTDNMKFLFGGESKCARDASGHVVGKPSTVATIFLLLFFLSFLVHQFLLMTFNSGFLLFGGKLRSTPVLILACTIIASGVGMLAYFKRYQKCQALTGFAIYAVISVLATSLGLMAFFLWVRKSVIDPATTAVTELGQTIDLGASFPYKAGDIVRSTITRDVLYRGCFHADPPGCPRGPGVDSSSRTRTP